MLGLAPVCLGKPIRSVMGSGNRGVPRPAHLEVERDSVPHCSIGGLGGFYNVTPQSSVNHAGKAGRAKHMKSCCLPRKVRR